MSLAGILAAPAAFRSLGGLISGLAAAAVVGFAVVQTVRLAEERAAHAATRAEHARAAVRAADNATAASEAAREEEARDRAAMQGIIDATTSDLVRARADAAAAGDAGRRLREQIARTAAAACRAPAGGAAAAAGGPAAGSAADLLADVRRRLDEAADGIARHADTGRVAGLACERAYLEVCEVRPEP